MRLRPLRWPTLVALVALVACATAKKGPGPGEQRGARQRGSELRFSHALHAEQEIGCDTCHAKMNQAGDLGRRHSPSKATCADCHEVKDKKACTTCHPDPRRARKLGQRPPSPGLIFSHRAHAKRASSGSGEGSGAKRRGAASAHDSSGSGEGSGAKRRGAASAHDNCVTCHAGAAVAKSLTAVPRPKMRGDCFACHNHLTDYRHMRCKRCHDRLSHHPIKVVSTFSHAGNFLKEHGRWARTSADLCGSCHQQSYCADCHSQRATVLPSVKLAERTDRRFIHRGDWISRHAAQSRADPGRCTKCHSEKRCASCHKARGIHSGSSSARGRTPHPPGWLSPGSPNSHGLQARRRITQCAGCHDRGALSNCVRCHKSIARGGLGVRPHPPGWSRGSKTGHRVCLVCH